MTDFDPLKTDAYAKHLAAVNETHSVHTTEDIRNAAGVLVAKKGIALDKNTTDKILQHRLLKPLQDCVMIEQSLDGERLYQYLIDWIQKHEDLLAIHQQMQLDRAIKALCKHYHRTPILHQILTVLSTQLPETFDRACFTAWMATATAQQRRLSVEDTMNVFLAGLCHDIGLLHIPENILRAPNQQQPAEWRMFQAHPVIGQKIIAAIPGLSKHIGQIILEHHEACDGTGYPSSKMGNDLHSSGQLLALCDNLYSLRFNPLFKNQRTLKDLQPYLNLNQEVHLYCNYQAMTQILQQVKLVAQRQVSESDMLLFCEQTLKKYHLLTIWGRVVHDVVAYLPSGSSEKPLKIAFNMLAHIKKVIRQSGLFNEGIQRWIIHVQGQQLSDVFAEIEEIGLMYDELLSHMHKLHQQISVIIEQDLFKKFDHQDEILACAGLMQQLKADVIPEVLSGTQFNIENLMAN